MAEKEQLEVYGIDSVAIMSVNRELEKDFGKLPATLFFEYTTLLDLAKYFLEKHEKKLVQMFLTSCTTQSSNHKR